MLTGDWPFFVVADYDTKSPSAVDYSDIQETAEDESSQDETKTQASSETEEKQGMHWIRLLCACSTESQFWMKFWLSLKKKPHKKTPTPIKKNRKSNGLLVSCLCSGGDEEEEGGEKEEDKDRKLMPPPTWLPTPSMIAAAQQAAEAGAVQSNSSAGDEAEKPKLNTPLAGMLPPELASVDVTTIFPEFRPGKVRLGWADM